MDDNNEELQIKASGLSTSFTISFEDETEKANVIKQKRIIKTANMFTKKHYRTLSLPVANNTFFSKSDAVKYGCDSETKEMIVSEDNSRKCIPESKEKSNAISTRAVTSHRSKEPCKNSYEAKSNHTSTSIEDTQPTINLSDTDSEGGTYTIDKNNEQVKEARKSIDQVFGITSENQNDESISSEKKLEKRTRMVDEWIEHNASVLKTDTAESPKTSLVGKPDSAKSRITKIPFPVERSRESSSTNLLNGLKYQPVSVNGSVQNAIHESKSKQLSNRNQSNGDESDTEHYLRETENIVCALQKRINRNTIKPQPRVEEPKIPHKDQNGKETAPSKYSITRFNRAFSLRRDRSKKPTPVLTSSTTVPVRSKTFVGASIKSTESASPKSIMKRNNSFCKDFIKSDNTSPKLRSTPRPKTSSGDLGRKLSAKATQEIELHNWKRRKNYDPLKAVAEEKKRKALAGAAANSASSAHLKQTSNSLDESDDLAAKIITRSASFHGLRNKNGYDAESSNEIPLDRSSSNRSVCSYFISSNEDATEYDNDSEDHWVIPKPPSTSLQNTPPESISSRLSLLSNAASNSSVLLLTSSTITNVDSATVSKVTQMSYKIKDMILAFADSISERAETIAQNSKDHGVSGPKLLYDRENGEIADNICNQTEDDLSFVENDISADYQLNIALNNLNEIHQAVQKLNVKCSK
ncbi:uncharacterized protein LOC135840488 [Planococcus citri]|uniref:uncharacterized protein LOC135840488 n=1 Tax=Planococcus citri TaxID=170843 RepID=UPI0031F9BB2B